MYLDLADFAPVFIVRAGSFMSKFFDRNISRRLLEKTHVLKSDKQLNNRLYEQSAVAVSLKWYGIGSFEENRSRSGTTFLRSQQQGLFGSITTWHTWIRAG